MKRLLFSVLYFLATISFATASPADYQPTPRQKEIFLTVMNVTGYIDQKLHAEYWAIMPPSIMNDPKVLKTFRATIDLFILPGTILQREAWISMRKSQKAGRVVKTAEYAAAIRAVLSIPVSSSVQAQTRASIQTGEQMIQAAAKNAPFKTAQGPIYITPEMIDRVLGGLNSSMARVELLLNPTWVTQKQEYTYNSVHVAILSDQPFSKENSQIGTPEGRSVNFTSLTKFVSSSDIVVVNFYELGTTWRRPENAVVRTVNAALKGAGASVLNMHTSKWRGRTSATGTGSANTSEGNLFISARVVELREFKGALMFLAQSGKSISDADFQRGELELSTKVLH
jgi:hypothetical protein